MSTKNLSRTVIEGGRCGHYKSDVYKRVRQERAAVRVFLQNVALDPERFDEDAAPVRQVVSICQSDKLRPMFRFLDSAVGRRWDVVRSEVFRKFDHRTTAGRHVLFDHLLREVNDGGGDALSWYRPDYLVDEHGVLRHKAEPHRARTMPPWATHDDLARACAWLGHHKLGRMGAGFTTFVPVSDVRVKAIVHGYSIAYVLVDKRGEVIREPVVRPENIRYYDSRTLGAPVLAHVAYRQSRALDKEEEAFFRRLPQAVQKAVLAHAPANV
jgi:hypothetical protein